MTDLPDTKEEVKSINGLKTVLFKDSSATKKNLFAQLNHPKIIHISSHASASDHQGHLPWIASYDERIYLPEIYQMNLATDLVLISACETNLGEIQDGEGVISLTRGFMEAGANSVIASQWKVNAQSNAEIIQQFYKNLKKHSKSEALTLAKRAYLKKNPQQAQSPYYWSSLIYYGQDGQIKVESPYKSYLFAIFGILSLGLLLMGLKKWRLVKS